MQLYLTPFERQCQVEKILKRARIKKAHNSAVIEYLRSVGDSARADRIEQCATFIGVTFQEGVSKIVKANFCRERLCYVCAWRRQSKFLAQMSPVLRILSKDYKFLFVTLTAPNVAGKDLGASITELLSAYSKFTKRRQVKRAFEGVCRALEISYNETEGTFHPHLHLLVAVRPAYFTDTNLYFSQREISALWQESLGVNFVPVVDIRAVKDVEGAEVETLKYTFKPPRKKEIFSAFATALKGRRLVSFTGVFAKIRKELRFSSFEDILTDDVKRKEDSHIYFDLYKFDATGGVYTFYKQYEL